MISDKRIGEYCNYVKQYVAVKFRYLPDGSSSRSCENSACGNSRCNLCDSFQGDRSQGKDFLGQPNQGSG
jgi:hypothetical protein